MFKTLFTVVLAAGFAAGDDEVKLIRIQSSAIDQGVDVTVEVPMSDYWIGVLCEPVDELIRIHLKLDGGLVVRQVVEQSPAAQGGLGENDIILKVNDQQAKDLASLVQQIDQAKSGKITLSLLRDGEPLTVEVSPAHRPEDSENAVLEALEDAGVQHQHLKKELKELELGFRARDLGAGRQGRMLFVKPGLIVPGEFMDGTDFPKNLEISISKKGDGPARISVARDGQSWEVDENELDKLPDDIRPFVSKFISGNGLAVQWAIEPKALFLPDGERFELKIPDLKFKFPEKEFRQKIESSLDQARVRLNRVAEPESETVERLRTEIEELKREVKRLRDRAGQ